MDPPKTLEKRTKGLAMELFGSTDQGRAKDGNLDHTGNPFSDNLYKKPPIDMDNLRARATRYIQREVMALFQEKMRLNLKKPLEMTKPEGKPKSQGTTKPKPPPALKPKFAAYTPLTESRTRILEEACSTELLYLSVKGKPCDIPKF